MPPRKNTPRCAFTLTEVVIAIGLFAFAILGVVYLLGTALGSAKEIREDSNLSNVIQTSMAIAQSFPQGTTGTTNLFFNSDGVPTASSDQAHYRVELREATFPPDTQLQKIWITRIFSPFPSTNAVADLIISARPSQ